MENEVTNGQAKTSTNIRREERNKNTFPTTTSIIVLRIQIALYKLPRIKLTIK